jgi:biotin carboxyl carrier protein
MKIYKVKVNGKLYEVELESITQNTQSVESNAQAATPVNQAVASGAVVSGAVVKAPMQGTILDVKVKVGDFVKKGQSVFVLEAMKLENEIVSPTDGVIKQVSVTKGQAVNNLDVLAIIG